MRPGAPAFGYDFCMANPVVHFEIGCRDRAQASAFYSELFDWQIADAGPASMVAAAEGGITGHMTSLGHEPFHYTIFYVQVDDVQAYLDRAAALGAKTVVPPVTIPTGTFAWLSDPDGNTVGLWKPAGLAA
jgi:predicted enzyme related to lactoylglutathione lyase